MVVGSVDASDRLVAGWRQVRRRDFAELWDVAGFRGSWRVLFFVLVLAQPPLMSSTCPRVAANLTVKRSRWTLVGILALCVVGVGVGVELPRWWVVAFIVLWGVVVTVWALPAAVTWRVSAGGVLVHDVVAERRGTGVGEWALQELLAPIAAPVELVASEPKVIAIYERLGFVPTAALRNGRGRMRRAGTIASGRGRGWRMATVLAALCGAGGVGQLELADPSRVALLVALAVATVMAWFDLAHLRLPNVGVAVIGVAAVVVASDSAGWVGMSVAGVGSLLVLLGVRRWSHHVGLGDVKFLAVCTAVVGAVGFAAALVVPAVTFLIAGVTARPTSGPRPLGPVIAIATSMAIATVFFLPEGVYL